MRLHSLILFLTVLLLLVSGSEGRMPALIPRFSGGDRKRSMVREVLQSNPQRQVELGLHYGQFKRLSPGGPDPHHH